ncbi:hypothetical protein N9H89_01995 [Flavobacteriaceae bacterium]|nr:hypothetical protein [Flavobacteriaceae bacterium]
MKKGLLSILAGALLVVGCQNYDDQFDALETQINSLTATVAGLAQVQSDLTSLAGTVSSLASTVNGLGDTIDTAVADGLTDIQADIDAIEAAVADVASSEEVSALSDAVADAQTDLTDLLAASSVFTGDVIVNSAQTLDAYHKMGAGLNIVNGNVAITVETSMDQAKVQELVDNILTVVQDFKYTSKASSIAETTFENLTGTRSLTITQGGGMRFPNLVSATNIYLNDDFESTVGVIHFGSLTSVATFNTDSDANTIQFTKATELHLTALEYYPPATLTIETDEGAAMPFALDDLDADGDELEDGLTLSIKGPASVAITKIADGSITLEDVASASLTDFKGSVTLTGDVTSFTSNSLVNLTVSAGAGIETIDVTGIADPDAADADDANYYGPAIDLDTLGDLETVTIAGIAESVNLGTNNNLTDITISADVAGSITIDNNSDLSNITLTGAKATALNVATNSDLTTLTVDLTWRAGTATGDVIDGDLDVTGNASLESLTVSSDNLENLDITGNDELTTLDFTGVTKIGATGTAAVNIYNNDLTASKVTDSDDGTTDVDNGATGDKGSITTTSGMDTLSDYLTAVAADADSAAAVYFDTVESFVKEDDSESTDKTYDATDGATQNDENKVLVLTAKVVTTAGSADVLRKRAYVINRSAASAYSLSIGGTNITTDVNSATPNAAIATITLDSNQTLALAQVRAAASITRAAAVGVTLDAVVGATPTVNITILETTIDASTNGENYTDAEAALLTTTTGQNTATLVGDTNWVKLTVGSLSVTATLSSLANVGTDAATEIAKALTDAWNTEYGGSGSSNTLSLVDTATVSGNVITLTGKRGSGRRAHNLAVALSLTTDALTTTVTPTVDWKIGASDVTTDNKLVGDGIILTLVETVAGKLASVVVSETGTNAAQELSSTLLINAGVHTSTTTDIYPTQARGDGTAGIGGDVVNSEGNIEEVATAAVSFSRVSWL